jgi:hypothetical protein
MKNKDLALRTALLCLALAVALGALSGVGASAADLRYSPSSAYRNSSYCAALLAVELTGDQRRDVINVALSQAGYREGDSEGELDGSNPSGTGNYAEYNRFYGKIGDSYAYAWCGSFVYWCMMHAGVPSKAYRPSLSCSKLVSNFREDGGLREKGSGYVPAGGDIVFFANTNTGSPSIYGIVVCVTDEWIYTVEGDGDNRVNVRRYRPDDSYIYAYGVPAYTSPAGTYDSVPELTDGRTGTYEVAADSVTIYKDSTGGEKLAEARRGELLELLSFAGSRGRVDVSGKTGFVPLSALVPYTASSDTSSATGEPGPQPGTGNPDGTGAETGPDQSGPESGPAGSGTDDSYVPDDPYGPDDPDTFDPDDPDPFGPDDADPSDPDETSGDGGGADEVRFSGQGIYTVLSIFGLAGIMSVLSILLVRAGRRRM